MTNQNDPMKKRSKGIKVTVACHNQLGELRWRLKKPVGTIVAELVNEYYHRKMEELYPSTDKKKTENPNTEESFGDINPLDYEDRSMNKDIYEVEPADPKLEKQFPVK